MPHHFPVNNTPFQYFSLIETDYVTVLLPTVFTSTI